MQVIRRREAPRSVRVARALGSTQCAGDGAVVLDSSDPTSRPRRLLIEQSLQPAGMPVLADHWRFAAVLSLCNCGLMVNHNGDITSKESCWEIKGKGFSGRDTVFSLRTPMDVKSGEQVLNEIKKFLIRVAFASWIVIYLSILHLLQEFETNLLEQIN